MKTLVFGGAASGKSEFAEQLAGRSAGPHFYIATLPPRDPESLARVKKHQAMRAKKGFQTIERYTDLASLRLPARGTVLLECLGTLTANELFSEEGAGSNTVNAILFGMESLEEQCDTLIVVTNDVFSDGFDYTDGTRFYLETLAAVNRELSSRFERTAEVVCGIPLFLKGACG